MTDPHHASVPNAPLPQRRSRLLRAARVLLITYFVTAVALYFLADHFILHPTRQFVDPGPARPINIAGPSGSVEIWAMPAPHDGSAGQEPRAFVLHFIGNASRAEGEGQAIAGLWSGFPVEVWTVNYPGYGKSEGATRLNAIPPAALAAYDELQIRAAGRPIFVSGRSIGTTAALYVAVHRPVAGVILHSPPPLQRLIVGHFGWWNGWLGAIPVALHVPRDLDSLSNAANVNAPGIFILSEADHFVPPDYQRQVVDAYAGPKSLVHMPLATHGTSVKGPAREELHAQLLSLWSRSGLPIAK